MAFILRVRYPHSGMIQDQEFPQEHLAIRAAIAHLKAFPAGLAQITGPDGKIVQSHSELYELFKQSS